MATAPATLGDIHFRLAPESVSWAFSVKTKVTNTLGGKVIQVYGTSIDDMRISGSFGVGGWQAQDRFIDQVRALAEKQRGNAQVSHRFLFPLRGWDFKVQIRAANTPDGGGTRVHRPDLINPRWALSLLIVSDNVGLKKIATDKYIARLSENFGWHQTAYNGDDIKLGGGQIILGGADYTLSTPQRAKAAAARGGT
jgi:hypothetical protein